MRLQLFPLIIYISRILLYKTCYVIKFIHWNLKFIQMNLISNLQGLLSTLNRYRRVLFAVLLVCVFILYLWPSWLKIYPDRLVQGALDVCVDSKLQPYYDSSLQYDSLITHSPLRTEEQYHFPFVGNGYIGTVVRNAAHLHLKHTRSMSVQLNYYPIVMLHMEGLTSQEATVIRLKDGIVNRIQCFEMSDGCINVNTAVYTHRSLPSVLVQDIRVDNTLNRVVTLDIEVIGVSDWIDSSTKHKIVKNRMGDSLDYQVTRGKVIHTTLDQIEQVYVVQIASPVIPQTITVQPNGNWKYQMYTFVKYTSNVAGKSEKEIQAQLSEAINEDMLTVLNIDHKTIQGSHVAVWDSLWQSGFGISKSLASGALNGDRINATMYYMLSQVRAPLHEKATSKEAKVEIQKQLYFPDRCYDGHHTLQNSRLWESVNNMNDLNEMIRMWDITLDKQGCATMLQAGASGVLQAMVLSLGALKFSNQHLEFGIHPSELHRDYSFRRLNYGNNTHVNISVIVNDDNKAMMYVALDQNDKPYYACEAACDQTPIHLSQERAHVPVKLTNPHTAILYITADLQHMMELKDAIHVNEIVEAPAHEHHVMALHRHGHHLGGLPAIFWISISILVLIFHMFLFKLVVNEYCQDLPSRYVRSKYNL